MDPAQQLRRIPISPEVRTFLEYVHAEVPSTAQHCARVADLCDHYAASAQLTTSERETLIAAAILHDIGKVFVPRTILDKPTSLTPEERSIMAHHVSIGRALIRPHREMSRIAVIVGQHHEAYNGMGYPEGLAGRAIDRLARILSVVDAFCAMVEDRTYSPPMPADKAIREIIANRGTQFDPDVVDVFCDLDLSGWATPRKRSA